MKRVRSTVHPEVPVPNLSHGHKFHMHLLFDVGVPLPFNSGAEKSQSAICRPLYGATFTTPSSPYRRSMFNIQTPMSRSTRVHLLPQYIYTKNDKDSECLW
ncbi:hypothetical protein ABKN59_008907 [Abortiporus biennis]